MTSPTPEDEKHEAMVRYGRVSIATIQKTKNELRAAIQPEGTEAIQMLWARLEQWIDSPSMMPAPDQPPAQGETP